MPIGIHIVNWIFYAVIVFLLFMILHKLQDRK